MNFLFSDYCILIFLIYFTGLIYPTGLCEAGFYCSGGSNSSNLPSTDATGGPCPTGSYCPQGSSSPIQCVAGSFTDIEQQSNCTQCPAGYYCLQGSSTPVICPKGLSKFTHFILFFISYIYINHMKNKEVISLYANQRQYYPCFKDLLTKYY